jgi:DNA-binding GntR family transcriptional regulator
MDNLLTPRRKSLIIDRMLKPMKRGTMRTQLSEYLSEAILHGELKPGERIIEIKLARQLGVGQSTLREALQVLEHRALITKFDNRGTFVTRISTKEVESIYAVRLELEPLAASLASQRMSGADLEALEKQLDKMLKAQLRVDLIDLMKQDFSFHQSIWKLSDNVPLEKCLNLVCAPLFTFYMLRFSANDFSKHTADFRKDYEEHHELLAALKKGGSEEVKKAFRQVLEVFRVRHKSHVQEAQDREVSSPDLSNGSDSTVSQPLSQ